MLRQTQLTPGYWSFDRMMQMLLIDFNCSKCHVSKGKPVTTSSPLQVTHRLAGWLTWLNFSHIWILSDSVGLMDAE